MASSSSRTALRSSLKPSSIPSRLRIRSSPVAPLAEIAEFQSTPSSQRSISTRTLQRSCLRHGQPRLRWASASANLQAAQHDSVDTGPEPLSMPEFAQEDIYEIVIIGGGPAGLALACTLREYLLLLSHRYPVSRVC